jgi:6-phosphogluconolactonase
MIRNEVHVYLGTLTHPLPFAPEAGGEGIVFCSLDTETGGLEKRGVTGGILNPSYLAVNESGAHLFAITCDTEAECHVHAFRRADNGTLIAAGVQPTGARVGCHISVMPSGSVCAVSYFDSSIAVFPAGDGEIGPREFHIRYQGSSINAQRQEDSHAHQAAVSMAGCWLYVCDLGADRIWRHEVRDARLVGGEPEFTATPAGYGPRHLVFHPTLPCAYVICELNAHVLTYGWRGDTGGLALLSDLPSLPDEGNVTPAAAAIRTHPSGAALYVSNRNIDSLDYFTLDHTGHPTLAGHLVSGGVCPRDFAIEPSGRWLLAANQDSNCVAIHELNPKSGLPIGRAPGLFPVTSPACVLICKQGS